MNDIRSQIDAVAKAIAAPSAPRSVPPTAKEKRRVLPKVRANDIAGKPRRDKQRRQEASNESGLKESRFWLFFTTGRTVDPRACPKKIQAHGHWVQVDDDNSKPNCVCKCLQPDGEVDV